MKRFWNAFWPMVSVGACCWVILGILLRDMLLTIALLIGGETYYFLPWILLIAAFCSAVTMVTHRIQKSRDGTAKREYLIALGGEVYDPHTDAKAISRDPNYRAELAAYAVVATLEIALTLHIIYWPIIFPLMFIAFWVFDRRLWRRYHSAWAEGRLHLNPHQSTQDQPKS